MPNVHRYAEYSNLPLRQMHRSVERKPCFETNCEEKLYEVCRGEADGADKNGKHYGGVFFRNTFRVLGGPIYLHKVGFFGPKKVDVAVYSALVRVEKSPWGNWGRDSQEPSLCHSMTCLPLLSCLPIKAVSISRRVRSRTTTATATSRLRSDKKDKCIAEAKLCNYTASGGNIWWVAFSEPVQIPEMTWIEVSFQIEGDKALACMKSGEQLMDYTIETERGRRHFEFLHGSCQMPLLAFSVDVGAPDFNGDTIEL